MSLKANFADYLANSLFSTGITYILEKLPEGYVLMDRPRGTDQKVVSVPFWI